MVRLDRTIGLPGFVLTGVLRLMARSSRTMTTRAQSPESKTPEPIWPGRFQSTGDGEDQAVLPNVSTAAVTRAVIGASVCSVSLIEASAILLDSATAFSNAVFA